MPAPDLGSNLVELFERTADRHAAAPFLWATRDGSYQAWSWQRVAHEARALARGLRARGVAPGDRVLLVAENLPEWAIADLAIMGAGGVTVPAYTTNTTENHRSSPNSWVAAAAPAKTR
jgi:long-chain acyl-CoA synthetase